MGQKVHPIGMRLGIVSEHTSVWYADGRAYADKLHTDLRVREYLQKRLKQASVSRIYAKVSRLSVRHRLRVSPYIRRGRVSSSGRRVKMSRSCVPRFSR